MLLVLTISVTNNSIQQRLLFQGEELLLEIRQSQRVQSKLNLDKNQNQLLKSVVPKLMDSG